MARILLLLIIGIALYALLRGFFRSQVKDDRASQQGAARPQAEDMVACTRCGVNLPRSEAALVEGKPVCRDNAQCR